MAKTNCSNHDTNMSDCPCADSGCERAGICCECIKNHLRNNSLVSCQKNRLQEDSAFRSAVAALVAG